MPREIVLGNGELLVNLDRNLFVRDIYYPYVGWANHVGGYRCRVGVWVEDGGLAWLDDAGWERKIAYAADTLVTDCTLRHAGLNLRLSVAQAVAHDKKPLSSALHRGERGGRGARSAPVLRPGFTH